MEHKNARDHRVSEIRLSQLKLEVDELARRRGRAEDQFEALLDQSNLTRNGDCWCG